MNKDLIKFYKREWKDADLILNLDRASLLWQIYQERSAKLFWLLLGIIIGIGTTLLFI